MTQTISLGKVLLVGGNAEYLKLFLDLGYTGCTHIKDADLVLFTGGEDVSPMLYDEVPLATTNYNFERDSFEIKVYEAARELNIPMVGICRGGQFLNVMNGGSMWQHVNRHTCNHSATVNKDACPWYRTPKHSTYKEGEIWVTSTHHQMMKPSENGQVLLTAQESTERLSAGISSEGKASEDCPDIEAVWYPDTLSLCFQPHPEFKFAPTLCVDFFGQCLDNLVLPALPLPKNITDILNTPVKEGSK